MLGLRFLLISGLSVLLLGAKGPVKIGSKKGPFVAEGVYIGGQDSGPASLLRMKLLKSPKDRIQKRERFYIQTGDAEGAKSSPPFIHMAVQSAPARLVIDISNTQKTAFGPEELRQAFSESRFIKNVSMTMDPLDRSTNITLNFDSPKKVAAFFSKKREGVLFFEVRNKDSAK